MLSISSTTLEKAVPIIVINLIRGTCVMKIIYKNILKRKLGKIFLSAQSFYLTLTKRSFNRHF